MHITERGCHPDQRGPLEYNKRERLDLFNDGQHGLGLVGRGGCGGKAFGKVRVGYAHGVVPPHGPFLLGLAHGCLSCRKVEDSFRLLLFNYRG
jgi:hypothetical protein